MAVHGDYPGLKVQIFVNGKPLDEHGYEEEEELPKTTTRYVECHSGAEFAIKTSFTSPFPRMDLSIRAYLDGTLVRSIAAFKQSMLEATYTQSTTMEWKDGAEWRASNFLFSNLSVGMLASHETIKHECILTEILQLRTPATKRLKTPWRL